MRLLDLFSGIGGFSLAASWVWGDDLEIVGFCEQDRYCQAVLKKHWSAVPVFDDIKELDGSQFESVDLVTGGFPCQPYSVAGKRRGKEDDRSLWPEMLRVVQEVRPRWVIGENVGGFVKMGLDQSFLDLEAEGYSCGALIIPACSKDAPHRRDRLWIIAHAEVIESGGGLCETGAELDRAVSANGGRFASDTEEPGLEGGNPEGAGRAGRWPTELAGGQFWDHEGRPIWGGDLLEAAASLCGVDDGLPGRVDRLKALGNAIVPQVAAEIMYCIKELDR